ncbi:MAG: YicC family protein [Betaproteobacteria bacterium]|nr:YicC family protein [Betaproteobacteria bacterium]
MTGFAAVFHDTEAGRLQLELRSVNSRFLDLQLRMPDDLRSAEPALRELLTAGIARGKVECRISLQRAGGETRQPVIDRGLLAQLLTVAGQIAAAAPGAAPPTVADLMRWPGLIAEPSADTEALQQAVVTAARAALAEFSASRAREGARLAAIIGERGAQMRAHVAAVRAAAPALLAAFEARLVERLRAALGSAAGGNGPPLEPLMDRIGQEVTLHGMRIDVAEEIARLDTHLDELDRVLAAGGAVGKRLDFLLQELNREANTLGSKGASVDLTATVIELKLLIEQIREQVQNLE